MELVDGDFMISIHALREESDSTTMVDRHKRRISIHALREESDMFGIFGTPNTWISIHALREESDHRQV